MRDSACGGRGRTVPTHYGPIKQLAEAHYASVKCIRFLCFGHLAIAFPHHLGPEVHMWEKCVICSSVERGIGLTMLAVLSCSLTGEFFSISLLRQLVVAIEKLYHFKYFTASPRVLVENDTTYNTTHNTAIHNIRSPTGIR